jgi:hypothetical protein
MIHNEQYNNPKALAELIRIQTRTDIHGLMKSIAGELLEESKGDTHATYDYFSPVYDELYHAIIFEKISIQEETRQLLEILATPIFRKTREEQQEIIQKYIL